MKTNKFEFRQINIEKDAEKLAKMWNDSDDQWPGTWTNGVPMTAQAIREDFERENALEIMVADNGEDIGGFCSIWMRSDENNASYVALLNVSPQFQKNSVGRKLLKYSVQRAAELNHDRIDLSTWPGNIKAVPLYKKCGFFWVPKTSVEMVNFIPQILKIDCLKNFFEKNDWYSCLDRELNQVEDEEKWEGLKVFTYKFKSKKEEIIIRADKQALGITSLETPEFFAAAIPENAEPSRGLSSQIFWKIKNKTEKEMKVSIIANSDRDIKIDHRKTLTIAPHQTAECSASVEIPVKEPTTKKKGSTPLVKTTFVIDGKVLQLKTGFAPKPAIKISTNPKFITLYPDVKQIVNLQLQNSTKQEITATVSVAPEEGLTTNWKEKNVIIQPESRIGFPLSLVAENHGAYELSVSLCVEIAEKQVHIPAKDKKVFVLPAGEVVGIIEGDHLRIENEKVRFVIKKKGGNVKVVDLITNEELLWESARPAPPVWPSEYTFADYDLQIEKKNGNIIATATAASKENPGFFFHKKITVGNGDVFSIENIFDNRSSKTLKFQLSEQLIVEGGHRVLPLKSGIIRGSCSVFPGFADDDYKKPEVFCESWMAVEKDNKTIGVIWPDDIKQFELGWGIEYFGKFYDCLPQSQIKTKKSLVKISDGDWKSVRKFWQRIRGKVQNEPVQKEVELLSPLALKTSPEVLAFVDDEINATLKIQHSISRKVSGKAKILFPEKWSGNHNEIELIDVNWKNPVEQKIQITAPAGQSSAIGKVQLSTNECDSLVDLPLIRLGNRQKVQLKETLVNGKKVLTLNNGAIEIDISPDFAGSIIAFRENKVNHLFSSFPDVGTLGWMSPFYGGIQPYIGELPGELYKEVFSADPISCHDSNNIEWTGIRQRVNIKEDEDFKGLILEFDFLTVGNSKTIKLVARVKNLTSATWKPKIGFAYFLQPDGSKENTVLCGTEARIKPTDQIITICRNEFGIAKNSNTGKSLILVGDRSDVHLKSWGKDGGHLQYQRKCFVKAEGMSEIQNS